MQTLPNGILATYDDDEARTILAAEGALEQMKPIAPFNHSTLAWWSKERRAYMCATLDERHPDPKDNGYIVLAIPETVMSADEAAKFIHEFNEQAKICPIEVQALIAAA